MDESVLLLLKVEPLYQHH